jgi:chromosome segregation and condensation protein ScpB
MTNIHALRRDIKIASHRGKKARGVVKALETDGLVGNNVKDKNGGSYGN